MLDKKILEDQLISQTCTIKCLKVFNMFSQNQMERKGVSILYLETFTMTISKVFKKLEYALCVRYFCLVGRIWPTDHCF